MSHPADKEAPKQTSQPDALSRWSEEVLGFIRDYEEAVAVLRKKVSSYGTRLDEIESSFSEIIAERKPDRLRSLYEKALAFPLYTTQTVPQRELRPRAQYRRLGAELKLLSKSEPTGEQLALLAKFKQIALELNDELTAFYRMSRYAEGIVDELLSRLRYIHETENQTQLANLNQSLAK